jgi:hypothetical protein
LRTLRTRSHPGAAITWKVETKRRFFLFDQLNDRVEPLFRRLGHDEPRNQRRAEQCEEQTIAHKTS